MSLTASRFALCLCLATALPAWSDSYTIRGAGPCDEWKADAGDRGWLLGYISGYNAARSSNLTEGMKNDELVEQMTQICKDDPSQDFDDAVQVLIGRLVGARETVPEPTPPAASPPAAPAVPTPVAPPPVPAAAQPSATPPSASSPVPSAAASAPSAPTATAPTVRGAPAVSPPAGAPTPVPAPATPPRSTLRPTAGSR
jgi:hypothetical protein